MYVKVRATPGAKKESVEKISDTLFEIKVKERPQKNAANKRIVELVARHFCVSLGKVRIVNGHHHPSKLIYIEE
ncbi:MAG: DUF167 domain-containing protein [Parcubacteria group bacterium]|nr:DUF167 domain-containing protein [Parcubacteria group bacterium]